ncbi:glycosyltransferase [Luteimicrobium sp. NPDC057192]|uniref:glycosyltransferase n=1 Tax=Luteimicrobium sp. NPDC057192 TaxID=3346042 RepID=UPI00363F687E
MTVLNEAGGLPRFLRSLAEQSRFPAQVVVVDGGSTDGTVGLLRAWKAPPGVTIEVLVQPGAGIARGRNLAIERAQYEHVLVTDGGTTLSPRWVEALVGALEDGADVASGFFEPGGSTPFARTLATIILPRLDEIDPAAFLPSSRSVGFTRSSWKAVGGYPEWLDYCEDLVLDLDLKNHGASFAFVPEAVATWDARPTLAAFARQYYRYARGDGKAKLWPRRHAIRYGAYALGVALLASRSGAARIALVAGGAVYLRTSVRRVVGRGAGPAMMAGRLAAVPLVVLTGDLAKMVGYPAGLSWRRRTGRGGAALGAEARP